jgi:hypothetical protein
MAPASALSCLSVRQRLTAKIALLTTLALVAVGVTLYVLESRRINRQIDASMSQESGEFRALQAQDDPATRQPFTSADRLLAVFLERNLPDDHEQLFAFPSSGSPTYQGEPDASLQRSAAFPALVADLSTTGGSRRLEVTGREYRVAVVPVSPARGHGPRRPGGSAAHVQRDARPAGVGVRHPAPAAGRCRARAAHAPDRPEGAPGGARPARPAGRRGHPDPAAGRDRPRPPTSRR